MRRVIGWALILLLALGGTALAATAMGIRVNGIAVTPSHAPEYRDGVLMVPAADLGKALGVDVKVNVQTNNLEITDNRAARITELEAKVKELEAKLPPTPAAGAPSAVTAANLVETLNQKFGTFQKGTRKITVTWSTMTTVNNEALLTAEMGSASYLDYLYMAVEGNKQAVYDWFKQASDLIKTVHGTKFSAALLMRETRSSYPSVRYDHVDIGNDLKWHVTEYLIWALNVNGQTVVEWD